MKDKDISLKELRRKKLYYWRGVLIAFGLLVLIYTIQYLKITHSRAYSSKSTTVYPTVSPIHK